MIFNYNTVPKIYSIHLQYSNLLYITGFAQYVRKPRQWPLKDIKNINLRWEVFV